jgi:phosphoglycerate dehydrogenase-like enzyme
MKRLRILVDFAAPPDALNALREGVSGHELVLPQTLPSSVPAAAVTNLQLTTADVAFGQPDPQAVAEAAQLKWLQISSSGITRYDNPRFRALVAGRNIAVSNSASVYNEACAVHVLSFMLAQARKLPFALGTRMAGGSEPWHALRNSCATLCGENVLIVGYGAIGKRLAELLRPFGANLTVHRRKQRGDEDVPVVTQEQLSGVLRQANHVVNILPDNAETRHFFNRARFAIIKPGAIFYNIGWGATVDQDVLLEVLRSKRLGAAWLDVTEPEPLPEDHPLRSEPNAFITPHIVGGQPDEAKALVRHFLANLDRFVRGDPLLDRVM